MKRSDVVIAAHNLKVSSVAVDLAIAALKIASANHYLVGFASETTDGISFDDFTDAYRLLVDMELADTKQTHRYDLAFLSLDALCYAQHKAHLSR